MGDCSGSRKNPGVASETPRGPARWNDCLVANHSRVDANGWGECDRHRDMRVARKPRPSSAAPSCPSSRKSRSALLDRSVTGSACEIEKRLLRVRYGGQAQLVPQRVRPAGRLPEQAVGPARTSGFDDPDKPSDGARQAAVPCNQSRVKRLGQGYIEPIVDRAVVA